ncbi:MAG: PIN domain-containing protein [Saprospiraceae bacterium]|nr:PIN domain-containing protein [Saprospiraceae bacterium]
MQIFLDTNVIIDFLTKREPFSEEIKDIFQYSVEGKYELYVSSVTISNTYYIISKLENVTVAKKKIGQLLELVQVLNVGQSTIRKAIDSRFKDFEDGVQSFCAEEGNLKKIITRNVKDFKASNLIILTPKEFLISES